MKKFNFEDWDIEPEIETNGDDLVYGHYVDWDAFREENEESLLDYFGVNLPWNQELTVIEYVRFVTQRFFQNTTLIEKYNFDKLPIYKQGNELSNLTIQFVDRDDIDSNSLIADIFDYYGVPSETQYEKELPKELQYWSGQDYLDNEYEYYRIHPIEIIDYKNTISEIQSKINNSKDELVIKSLILYALIISESLIKSIISNNLPQEKDLSEFSKNIIEKAINDKLTKNDGRNELFNAIFKNKAPKPKWLKLRNFLAHDIESSDLSKGKISYMTLKGDKAFYEIDKLFKELLEFSEELENCIG